MSGDESDEDGNHSEGSEQPHVEKSRSVDSENFSAHVEGGGEATDVRDVPEDGYAMAPSRNNPGRNSSGEGDGSDSDNGEDSND